MLANPLGQGYYFAPQRRGAIAQLGERLHGMQEVSGSIPLGSTKLSALGRRKVAKNIDEICVPIV